MKTRQYTYHTCITYPAVCLCLLWRNMSYVLLPILIKCIGSVPCITCTLQLMVTLIVITNTEHIHFTVVIAISLVIFLFSAMYMYNIYLYWTKSSFGVGHNTTIQPAPIVVWFISLPRGEYITPWHRKPKYWPIDQVGFTWYLWHVFLWRLDMSFIVYYVVAHSMGTMWGMWLWKHISGSRLIY